MFIITIDVEKKQFKGSFLSVQKFFYYNKPFKLELDN